MTPAVSCLAADHACSSGSCVLGFCLHHFLLGGTCTLSPFHPLDPWRPESQTSKFFRADIPAGLASHRFRNVPSIYVRTSSPVLCTRKEISPVTLSHRKTALRQKLGVRNEELGMVDRCKGKSAYLFYALRAELFDRWEESLFSRYGVSYLTPIISA